MFAVDHYRETGKILLHGEVKAILAKRRGERVTKERKHEHGPERRAVQQEEMRL